MYFVGISEVDVGFMNIEVQINLSKIFACDSIVYLTAFPHLLFSFTNIQYKTKPNPTLLGFIKSNILWRAFFGNFLGCQVFLKGLRERSKTAGAYARNDSMQDTGKSLHSQEVCSDK